MPFKSLSEIQCETLMLDSIFFLLSQMENRM